MITAGDFRKGVTIELDGDNELKSGGHNAGLEKNGHESSGKLTIKDDKGKDGSLTAEGGDKGGMIIAEGTPEQVAATKGSYTGEYIKMMLERDKKRRADLKA